MVVPGGGYHSWLTIKQVDNALILNPSGDRFKHAYVLEILLLAARAAAFGQKNPRRGRAAFTFCLSCHFTAMHTLQ